MLRLIDRLRKRFQRDKGYLVIEATFVYPLIFFVLMFLLYMGNMYYLKARIDSEVSQEAVYYAAQYADPNLKTIENGVPASAEGTTRVTDNLYRYVNFLDIGDFGKADTNTKNALIDRISDTGLFSGMTPYDIDVVKHEVNNYVIYQTYEVEVSYKINIPIRFLFTDEITLADMSAREEAAVTDTSEFIRNVDMAVDYVERSKSGDQFIAKINEVYGRVNEFINGEKYDPSDAAAGGSPGGEITPPNPDGLTFTKGYAAYNNVVSVDERIKRSPLEDASYGHYEPMHEGGTVSRGNGLFVPNNPDVYKLCEQYGVKNDQGNYGVEYKNGIPDFSSFAIGEVTISNMTQNRNNAGGNYEQADIELAKQWGCEPKQVKDWREKNAYTWHELNDVKTMQLVPTVINKTFIHMGGSSESQYYKP